MSGLHKIDFKIEEVIDVKNSYISPAALAYFNSNPQILKRIKEGNKGRNVDTYSEKLDADGQISAEEWIAAKIFDSQNREDPLTEDKCQKLGQEILKEILRRFAPGFFDSNEPVSADVLNMMPGIEAEIHSDDHVTKASFKANAWFAQATDEQIRTLAKCGWGYDYGADEVGKFYRYIIKAVGQVFDYARATSRVGYEVTVDERLAAVWLKIHRPSLYEDLREQEQILDI